MDIRAGKIADRNEVAQETLNRSHFYFYYKDAALLREKALKKLAEKIWKPWNCGISDVLLVANDRATFSIVLKYSNGKEITLFDFMSAQKIDFSFFD